MMESAVKASWEMWFIARRRIPLLPSVSSTGISIVKSLMGNFAIRCTGMGLLDLGGAAPAHFNFKAPSGTCLIAFVIGYFSPCALLYIQDRVQFDDIRWPWDAVYNDVHLINHYMGWHALQPRHQIDLVF